LNVKAITRVRAHAAAHDTRPVTFPAANLANKNNDDIELSESSAKMTEGVISLFPKFKTFTDDGITTAGDV